MKSERELLRENLERFRKASNLHEYNGETPPQIFKMRIIDTLKKAPGHILHLENRDGAYDIVLDKNGKGASIIGTSGVFRGEKYTFNSLSPVYFREIWEDINKLSEGALEDALHLLPSKHKEDLEVWADIDKAIREFHDDSLRARNWCKENNIFVKPVDWLENYYEGERVVDKDDMWTRATEDRVAIALQELEAMIRAGMQNALEDKVRLYNETVVDDPDLDPLGDFGSYFRGRLNEDSREDYKRRQRRQAQGNWKNSIGQYVQQHSDELEQARKERDLQFYVKNTMMPALGDEAKRYLESILQEPKHRNNDILHQTLWNIALAGDGYGTKGITYSSNRYKKLEEHQDEERRFSDDDEKEYQRGLEILKDNIWNWVNDAFDDIWYDGNEYDDPTYASFDESVDGYDFEVEYEGYGALDLDKYDIKRASMYTPSRKSYWVSFERNCTPEDERFTTDFLRICKEEGC